MPIRVLNMNNRLVNLKAGIKVTNLISIETNEQVLCFRTLTEKNQPQISEIIDNIVKDEASMQTKHKQTKAR